jgi:hypothetical protein
VCFSCFSIMLCRSLIIVTAIAMACVLIAHVQKTGKISVAGTDEMTAKSDLKKPRKIKEALEFAKGRKYDTTLAILIDYSLHSGRKRAFLADISRGVVFDSFLVSHGCGDKSWGADLSKESAKFSNDFESHCSSLGKYRIGKRAWSDWGINVKYYLYGLDSSNSNAYKRTIVLHGWGDIPDMETYPAGIPEGWGCPAVSDNAMRTLDSILQTRKKPVLMWVFN